MKAMFDAVFAHYNAAGAPLTTLALYNTEADDKAEFPYSVVQLVVGSPDDRASGGHYTEEWTIQFNLFDRNSDLSNLLTAYTALLAAFDLAALTVVGYNFLSCVRPPGSMRMTKVEGVWQINVIYEIKARAI